MAISRRRFVASVAAGSALAAVSTGELVSAWTTAAFAASPPGDVVGKITVGYQGWFACIGDGAPINAWWHWSSNWSQPPSPSNNGTLRAWPDMREYTHAYQTAYANVGSGQPARLFSSYDQQTVDTHFLWMQQNNIDTAALQRFNPNGGEGATRDAMAAKVRSAAESQGRKFYIMYDVTGWTNMQPEIKTDWTSKMSAHTASTAYARQNGKPVVCIWGFGFNDGNHPWDAATCLDVINWFKGQGCYVIGGVPREWRIGIDGSRAGFLGTYHGFNMISPWMVGAISNATDSDNIYNQLNVGDQADCNANGIDYQPCVLPGDVSGRQRTHGDFMWRQFYNMVRVGAQGIYISMYDEFNEGNQICKTAATQADVPTNSGLLALDEDGTACSSDYYLRLTGDGGRMLKGQIALTPVRPTQPNGAPPPPTGNLALSRPTQESSHNQTFVSGNATDGNQNSYWESTNNAFPQWVQVDLGSVLAVNKVVLKLPASWGSRTQTLSVQASADGTGFTTAVNSGGVAFNPGSANTATLTFAQANARYVRVNITANTGWPAAQLSELEVYGPTTGGDTQAPTAPANLTSTAKTSISVSLAWTAATDNVGVTGYQVRQGSAVIGTTAATSFTATGLNPSTAHTFSVTAQDAAGNTSAASNAVTVTTETAPNTNMARGKSTSESSHTQVYSSANTVDGNQDTYWESANNAFPQWLQVDLGAATSVGRVVLKLPASWGSRTQTLSVLGSMDGANLSTTLKSSAGYTFSPSANTVTISFTATTTRFVRLNITANTGWPAGQISEFEVYAP